jgi:hypothetical protein
VHQSDEAIGKKWKLTRDFLRHVERHAAALRDRAGIGPLDKLSPKEVADKFDTRIVYPDEITALPPEDRAYLSSLNAKVWSGISKTLPDGTLLVILLRHFSLPRL